jgi:hypothetical protein
VLSCAGQQALALVRIDRWHDATAPIMADKTVVHLRSVDWLPATVLEKTA